MPDSMRDVAHHVLQACANKGVEGFYPRVDGENLTRGSTDQDFVLNSHPVMVAPDTRAFSAAKRTALPPMNVPREAKLPVQTGEESVFVLSIVTQS
jgi:hypothetical protein